MEIRYGAHPRDVKNYDAARLREEFLIRELFTPGQIKMVYSHSDRMITGSVVPLAEMLQLEGSREIGSNFFLQRRELGIINIGESGIVSVDG